MMTPASQTKRTKRTPPKKKKKWHLASNLIKMIQICKKSAKFPIKKCKPFLVDPLKKGAMWPKYTNNMASFSVTKRKLAYFQKIRLSWFVELVPKKF